MVSKRKRAIADSMVRELGWRGVPYAVYLKTTHWQTLRARVFKLDKGRCVMCPRHGSCVHHRTYERLGSEWISDVVTLCENCHHQIHAGKMALDRPVRRKHMKKRWKPKVPDRRGEFRRHYARLVRKYTKSVHDCELVVLRRILLMEMTLPTFILDGLRRKESRLAAAWRNAGGKP